MQYVFINTDSDSFTGRHNISTWFNNKMAFTGGKQKYGRLLNKLRPNDICFMYENRSGVLGVGCVLEKWDGKAYNSPLYYISEDKERRDGIDKDGSEYRIQVDWFLDLRDSPIVINEIRNRFSYLPRGAVNRITKRRIEAEALLNDLTDKLNSMDELFQNPEGVPEGAMKRVWVNSYERSEIARRDCIKAWGYKCIICDTNLESIYGPSAKSLIHAHHLVPLSQIKTDYIIEPIKDMRPVCPNCHAVIHRRSPPYSIEEIKSMIKKYNS
jgi:hypothetical protein